MPSLVLLLDHKVEVRTFFPHIMGSVTGQECCVSVWRKWKRGSAVGAKRRCGRRQAVRVAATDFRMSRRDGAIGFMMAPVDSPLFKSDFAAA
jgi:hypothetical protein